MCVARIFIARAKSRTSTPRSISLPTSSTARSCATRTSSTRSRMQHSSTRIRSPDTVFRMSLVAKLLPANHVAIDLQVSSKKRLFEQAGLLFENLDGIARSQVFDSLFARERLASTGLGRGLPIPPGRIKGLQDPLGGLFPPPQPKPGRTPHGPP